MIDRTSVVGVSLDRRRPLGEQPGRGHNRWHPDVAPALTVEPGQPFLLDLIDASDALVVGTDQPSRPWDHARIHPLTGPVAVDGARVGDIVDVRVLDVETDAKGWTSARPGQGLIGAAVREELYAVWDLDRDYARSAQLPGIRVAARSFPGCLGVAPSAAFVADYRAREAALRGRGAIGAIDFADGAVPAQVRDGLRTLPPRPNGGNLDVPQLTRGSRALFAVQVDGALISAGDLHYAQGAGEMGGSAIETSGAVLLEARVHPAGSLRVGNPVVAHDDTGRGPSVVATGQGPADAGVADLGAAARAAAANLADIVMDLTGLDAPAVSILLSVAADLSFAQLVNHPYPTAVASLPLDVFAEHPSYDRWNELFRAGHRD